MPALCAEAGIRRLRARPPWATHAQPRAGRGHPGGDQCRSTSVHPDGGRAEYPRGASMVGHSQNTAKGWQHAATGLGTGEHRHRTTQCRPNLRLLAGGSPQLRRRPRRRQAMIAAVPDHPDRAGEPRIPAPGGHYLAAQGSVSSWTSDQGFRRWATSTRSPSKSAPDARVVYVDIDPVAVAHSRHILAGNDRATVDPGGPPPAGADPGPPRRRPAARFPPARRPVAPGRAAFHLRTTTIRPASSKGWLTRSRPAVTWTISHGTARTGYRGGAAPGGAFSSGPTSRFVSRSRA